MSESGRRSTEQRGYVRFPVDSDEYRNSNEGGLYVTLVVTGPDQAGQDWMCCWGPNVQMLCGDPTDEDTIRLLFPNAENKRLRLLERLQSEILLCAITLGSTGWSGWSDKEKDYWRCRRSDLTDEGERLYQLIENLYQFHSIRLVTWLDT